MRFAFVLALPLLPCVGFASLISFDEFGLQPSTFDTASPVNDRYLAQGVRFRGPGGSTELGGMMLNDSTFTVRAHSGNNFLAFTFDLGPETILFTSPQTQVSIYAASVDSRGGTFTLTAFDASGAQVASNSLHLNVDVWAQLSVSAASISRVQLTESTNAFTYVYDDLNFSAVPEPSALLPLSMGGLFLVRRKKRRASS